MTVQPDKRKSSALRGSYDFSTFRRSDLRHKLQQAIDILDDEETCMLNDRTRIEVWKEFLEAQEKSLGNYKWHDSYEPGSYSKAIMEQERVVLTIKGELVRMKAHLLRTAEVDT